MPEKIDPHSSYGRKLISLFAKLLFTKRKYSLIELSNGMGCSKQTIMRLIDDIKMSYGVEIEETFRDRRKFYQIVQQTSGPVYPRLSLNELNTLQMCKTFAEHLLGKRMVDEAASAIDKVFTHIPSDYPSRSYFGNYTGGLIDYSEHQKTLQDLISAIENANVCQVSYRSPSTGVVKSYKVEPLKIFSHQDSIYVHVRHSLVGDRDFLLTLHRIDSLQVLEEFFEYPSDYDFERVFNTHFGMIKSEVFSVTIEFKEFAAEYVAERNWNSEERKEWVDDDTLILTIKASSEPEIIGWVLSWGGRAKILKPLSLAENVKERARLILRS